MSDISSELIGVVYVLDPPDPLPVIGLVSLGVSQVTSLNGLTGPVSIAAGSNVSVAVVGQQVRISSTSSPGGVTALNGLVGSVGITAGSNVSVAQVGQNVQISSSGGVTTLNGLAGAVNLTAGSNVSLAVAGQNVQISSTSTPKVSDLNGLTGSVRVTAGSNVSVAVVGQDVQVSSTSPAAVNSLNSLTGAVNVTAGPNVSVAVVGQNVQVSSTPPDNLVVPGTTQFQISTNTTLTGNQQTVPIPTTSAIKFTNSSLVSIAGINSTGALNGQLLWLYNGKASGTIVIQDQNPTPTTAFRLVTGLNANISLSPGNSVCFEYDTALSRWKTIGLSPNLTNFLSIGSQTILGDKTFAAVLTIANSSGFLFCQGQAQFGSTTFFTGPAFFTVNTVTAGITNTGLISTNDIQSTGTGTSMGSPSGASMSLVPAVQLTSPSSATAIQSTPHLGVTTYTTAPFQNGGGTGFTADGSTYQYEIFAVNNLGQVCTSVAVADAGFTDDNSGLPFASYMEWTTASSLDVLSTIIVGRSINGSGFVYQDIGNVVAFTDDNTLTFTDSLPVDTVPDYVANGTNRSYNIVSSDSTPIVYYSASPFSYNFTDDSSNTPYTVFHSWSGGGPSSRVVGAPDGVSADEHFDVGPAIITFQEDSTSWVSGNTISPTTYGILSNGTNLNFSIDIWGRAVGPSLYFSPTFTNASTVDPNDGLYYTADVNWTGGSGNTSYTLLVAINGGSALGLIQTGTSLSITSTTTYPDSTITIPRTLSVTAATFANDGIGSVSPAAEVIKNTVGDYAAISFQDYTGAETSRIGSSTNGLEISSTAVGFLNAPPSAQQTGGPATAGIVYTATEQLMLQKVYDALRAFGFLS